ncbi:hypothetical protein ABIE21_003464 [Conyzicola nivalis]|jgi:hypothetical protein|uniref:Uncharacterized protein n=1 Tax=Conyzicola nivalis TaxID=1477021 RepID=A0ABV2QTX5_9MICO
MIAYLVAYAALTVWAVVATINVTARDGYRQLPTLAR